jgi:hypothetical protein
MGQRYGQTKMNLKSIFVVVGGNCRQCGGGERGNNRVGVVGTGCSVVVVF